MTIQRHGLPRLTIAQLGRLLEKGQVSSEQLCRFCHSLALAGEDLWTLRAFSRLTPVNDLLEQASLSDHRRKNGKSLSLLDGIPVSVKGNIAVASSALTAGSRILGSGRPETPAVGYDADVVRSLLHDSGAVLLGTTTQDEFGMGSLGSEVQSLQGRSPAKNPLPMLRNLGKRPLSDEVASTIINLPAEAIFEAHEQALTASDPHLSAGGSSCGSAISVSHGSSLLSLGSDTGGSVRLPASWCGVVGLKPSYGRLSRDGLVSYASSLDTIGVLAPTVQCARVGLSRLMQCENRRDATISFASPTTTDPSVTARSSLADVKIGIPAAFSVNECPESVQRAWSSGASVLQQAGATITQVSGDTISPDIVQKALSAYYVLVSAEASSNLARYDGFRYGVGADLESIPLEERGTFSLLQRQYAAARTRGFGKEVRRRVLCGTSVLSSDRFHAFYEAAAKLRALLTRQLTQALVDTDFLLIPTSLFPPPSLTDGEHDLTTQMLANDVMTAPISLAGLPAIAVPFPSSHGPSSLQLVGRRDSEDALLHVATVLQDGLSHSPS